MSPLGTYFLESRYEVVKTFRMPSFVIPTLTFPWMFYILFGLAFSPPGGQGPMATYLLATYGAFGVIGATLFAFGVGLASERAQGWLRLKRASPMPAGAYFLAKLGTAVLFSLTIVAGLAALATFVGEVELPASAWLELVVIFLAGTLPFAALGLTLGYLCTAHSAPAVINLIYLPMAFLSGLWIPIHILPGWVQAAAPFLPAYSFAQLALGAVGLETQQSVGRSLATLCFFTLLLLGTAYLASRRPRGNNHD
ncbi:MAG: ABC transporter permease [Acidobacteriota bacterium]